MDFCAIESDKIQYRKVAGGNEKIAPSRAEREKLPPALFEISINECR